MIIEKIKLKIVNIKKINIYYYQNTKICFFKCVKIIELANKYYTRIIYTNCVAVIQITFTSTCSMQSFLK